MFKIVKKMQKDRSSSKTKKESTESETNPEIFNDDDFYKSLILKGIKKIDDSVELSQEFEGSLSKSSHFGSKNSQSDKIDYTPHAKMVGFFTPTENQKWTDQMMDQLYSNLLQ